MAKKRYIRDRHPYAKPMDGSLKAIKTIWILFFIAALSLVPMLYLGYTAGRIELDFSEKAQWTDIDSDGLLDVVEKTQKTIAVFKNIGGGDFRKEFSVTTRGENYLDLIADLDSDGFSELVAGEYGVAGFIISLDGWKGENRYFGGDTSDLRGMPTTLDLEGDGILEIDYDNVIYREINGNYTAMGMKRPQSDILYSDLNGDSKDEIISGDFSSVGYYVNDSVKVDILSGAGGNITQLYAQNGSARWVGLVNASGALIFIEGQRLSSGSAVFLQNNDYDFAESHPVRWDREENIDNVARAMTGHAIYYNGAFKYGNATVVDFMSQTAKSGLVHAGDLNSDGILDIAYDYDPGWRSYPDTPLTLWLSNASGNDVTYHVARFATGVGARAFFIDIDQDGDLDLLTVNPEEDDFSVFQNNKGTFGPRRDHPLYSAPGLWPDQWPEDLEFADMDGDGNLDVLSGNAYGYTVSVAFGNGDGDFSLPRVYTTLNADFMSVNLDPMAVKELALIAVNDTTGDGRPDILFYCGGTTLLVNDGDGGFAGIPPGRTLVALYVALLVGIAPVFFPWGKGGVPVEGLTPSLYLGLYMRGTGSRLASVLYGCGFAYFIAARNHFPAAPMLFLEWGVFVALMVLGLAILARTKKIMATGTVDDPEGTILSSTRRFMQILPLTGIISIVGIAAMQFVVYGPSLASLLLVLWTIAVCLLVGAMFLSGWKSLSADRARTDFPKEWAEVRDDGLKNDKALWGRFEVVETGTRVSIYVDKSSRKEVLTVVYLKDRQRFSYVRLEGGRAVSLEPSSLLSPASVEG